MLLSVVLSSQQGPEAFAFSLGVCAPTDDPANDRKRWAVDKPREQVWKDRSTIPYLKPPQPDVFQNSELFRF